MDDVKTDVGSHMRHLKNGPDFVSSRGPGEVLGGLTNFICLYVFASEQSSK
jgi:hypothetical protein